MKTHKIIVEIGEGDPGGFYICPFNISLPEGAEEPPAHVLVHAASLLAHKVCDAFGEDKFDAILMHIVAEAKMNQWEDQKRKEKQQ